MKILLIAPHPFYQERGTPIAVDLLIKALCERGYEIDLLTFHEGIDKVYEGLTITRVKPFFKLNNIQPGFSIKKIISDVFIFGRFILMIMKSRYDVVHAVEESAFMAMLVCPLKRIPYIYDMDSSMTTQVIDKFPPLTFMRPFFHFFESLPMRFAHTVVPMCDVLADDARAQGAKRVGILKDVSLIKPTDNAEVVQIKDKLNLTGLVTMYIGNLESYQGIDLLLDSFALVQQLKVQLSNQGIDLVIIGGAEKDITQYTLKAEDMGLSDVVHFLGRLPVDHIGALMEQADILVSPRIHGVNTPMKVYSYLHSGVVVLATNLPTHTQVMDERIAELTEANKASYADGMLRLMNDSTLRAEKAAAAHDKMEREHSYDAFRGTLYGIYDQIN